MGGGGCGHILYVSPLFRSMVSDFGNASLTKLAEHRRSRIGKRHAQAPSAAPAPLPAGDVVTTKKPAEKGATISTTGDVVTKKPAKNWKQLDIPPPLPSGQGATDAALKHAYATRGVWATNLKWRQEELQDIKLSVPATQTFQ